MRIALFTSLLLLHPLAGAQSSSDSTSAAAWREFSGRLEDIGAELLNTYPQPHQLDRAEGLRYVLQQLASSIQQQLLEQPQEIPLLRIGATTINKWGLHGADAKYQGATIDSKASYRLHGQLGSARLFALQLVNIGDTYAAYQALTGDQLRADAAGNFDLLISPHKPEEWQGVWLQLNPESSDIILREYFSDWQTERPGTYYLQRLDAAPPGSPVTMQQMLELLASTADTFATRPPQWRNLMQQARQHLVNQVHTRKTPGQGLATNYYGSGWFKVADDEALILELAAPKALLWSVQLGNVWWESIDYINHTASINDSQAVISSDGKYRFVLSTQDPGVANWLDPNGHNEGMLLFRLQAAQELVNPEVKLVPFAKLAAHLPADIQHVNAEQRQNEILMRRTHAAVRWAP